MRCSRCPQENPPQARFCLACGAPLLWKCEQCGTELPRGARFCLQCGQSVTAPSPGEARLPPPESYTPKHLAEKILTSKSALEGERKQVTVLFADLKGSLELLADRDPEEARKLLDPVLERMMEAVHRYEGTVNQVMGDGIMALFGAPIAHEDHAARACFAALDMQAAIRKYAEEARRRHGIGLQIRVGLNSGEVVVRAIGSDLRMDYSAVGQTTHLAARMEQLADPGSILLPADTLRLAEGYLEVKPLGPVPLKGLPALVEVYEMIGVGPLRSRLQAAATRGLTRFVGRDPELERLREALGRAAAGQGQVVALVGEPGVGKSRLVWELTHSHRTHGWLILESGAVSYGRATAYLPVIDLLKGFFKIQQADDQRSIREKVTGKLLTLDRALEPTLPAFLALLDVPPDNPHWEGLDPVQRRRETLEAVKRLLVRESQVQPVLVVCEDLHWLDTESQAVLDGLAESLPAARLLLLVNYRPEYGHGWSNKTYYTQLRLDPLPPESAEALLQALLGGDAGLDRLKQLLIQRTEGNPFFLEESVRSLVETKALAGERGAYRLETALPSVHVPATVQAVLAARLDRLPPEEKRLLQAASAIGKDVPVALLEAIVEIPKDSLRQGLASLQAAEFLYETSLFPDLEYTFKHVLTHEVAYGSLLQDRRRALHATIVEAIERLYRDRLTEHIERLASHTFRGEMWEKALTYLRQAGAKAAARSSHWEAVTYFEQALLALQQLPESSAKIEQAIDLRLELRGSLFPLGELEAAFGSLRDAERLASTLGDHRRLGWVSAYLTYQFSVIGNATEAQRCGQRARAIAETLRDLPLQVVANIYSGMACYISGDYRRAKEFLLKTVQQLVGDLHRERLGNMFPAALARGFMALTLAECGEFPEGIARGEAGLHLAEEVNHPYSLVTVCWFTGWLYGAQGEFSQAVRLLERTVALAREWNFSLASPGATVYLGYVYTLAGRVGEALPLLQDAVKALESKGMLHHHSRGLLHLAEAYLVADRPEEARALAGRLLPLTRERGQRGFEAWALRLLGETAAHSDPLVLEEAEGHYCQAMALANELGMRPLMAHCHLGLGTLYRRTGSAAAAQEHLATATTMYREMGMGFWREKAEAEIAALR
jgi:class 3 adenylate cyclase/tetratricopeptide (TPR) repeat protein